MKRLILAIVFFTAILNGYAQRDYSRYQGSDYTSDTLRMDGYTYVCDTLKHVKINLYNIENDTTIERWRYKDGTPQNIESANNRPQCILLSEGEERHIKNIIDDAFSMEQVEMIKSQQPYHMLKDKLSIILDISSTDGSILSVFFEYNIEQGYVNIPICVYRSIEVELKNKVRFTLTDEGRKMNIVTCFWRQCPKGRIEIEPTIVNPSDGGGGGFTENPIGNNTNIITSAGGR